MSTALASVRLKEMTPTLHKNVRHHLVWVHLVSEARDNVTPLQGLQASPDVGWCVSGTPITLKRVPG